MCPLPGRTDAFYFNRVVLSSPPFDDGSVSDGTSVCAVYNSNYLCSRSVTGNHGWTLYQFDDDDESDYFEDVVYFKGNFYAVNQLNRVYKIDARSLKAVEVTTVGSESDLGLIKHMVLVESVGELFLVWRNFEAYSGTTDTDAPKDIQITREMVADFKLFKLNEENCVWQPVNSLGDRILFIGQECCYSVSAADFPGLEGNCIYFYDEDPWGLYIPDYRVHGLGDTIIGVFRMEDKSGGPLLSYPNHASIFFKPPSTLTSASSSSHF